ncbi:sorting nexin 1 isoform X1 [Selaginella moellendorffii]|uniref:sorting nexin 1 isoform X1 n=1 Tax=Selaginella moellendorffii TaxID=88036 RepID=UPI000D1C72C5|nr:sorting nexin 1 isoform X1 [Selaginella moellendorffii]|eukprot:XP_024527007.1 sorting nexin 1 isoform X1 [Selaginella moellendorffii]
MVSRQRSAGIPSSPNSPAPEQPFLSISVTDPVKLGNNVQAYISYRVSTKTNMQEYRGLEKIVIRRYSDFVWLHERLTERYKGIIIPPLPEKSAVEKFRFSAEFIEVRRRALDVFLNRIAAHPILRQSDDLKSFLQADEDSWVVEKSRTAEGVFKKKPSDFMQIFKDVQSKVTDVVLGKEKPLEETSEEYEKVKHYVTELEDHLGEAQKQSYRLVKRHSELGQALAEFGKSVKSLGGCETGLLGKAFGELGNRAELLSYKLQKQAQDLLMNFEEPLKEYVRTVQSIKAVLSDRAQAFRQQRELFEASKLKEINLEKLRVVRPDKVGEAEIDYRETKLQSDEANKRYEEIVKVMQQEMVRFQEEKTRDLGAVFHEFARGQAQLANDTAEAWKVLASQLDAWSHQSAGKAVESSA